MQKSVMRNFNGHTHQGTVYVGSSYQTNPFYMSGRGMGKSYYFDSLSMLYNTRPTRKQRKLYRSTWHHLNHHFHKGDFTTGDINQYLKAMSIMEEYNRDSLWVPMVKRYIPTL